MAKRLSAQDRLKRYRTEVEMAVKWRDNAGFDDTWRQCIEMYKGRNMPDLEDVKDRINVNIAFSTINVVYPSVSLNRPKLNLMAMKPEDEAKGVIAEVALNYWWRHFNFHDQFRLAVRDALMVGHGWVKVGWKFVEDTRDMTPEQYQEEFARQVQQVEAYAAENPELAGELPSDEEIATALIESGTVVVAEDRPFLDRVSPFHVYVNPDATCMQDVRWIAQRIIVPLEEIKADKRYSPSARKRLKANALIDANWLSQDEREKYQDQVDRVIIWEHYNLVDGVMCIFADGADEFLVTPMEIPFAFGHPFEMIRDYDVPEQFYPMGELEQLIPMQDELNILRSQMSTYRRRYARKYLFRERAFDTRGRNLLETNDDNVAIPVIDDSYQLNDVVAPMPQIPFDPQAFQHSDVIMRDAYEVSGVSEYQRGTLAQNVRRTATEASIISTAANARAAEKLDKVEQFVSRIGRKLLQVAQQFVTGEQMARIVGKDGTTLWVPFERDDIVGEFDFMCEAGSTQPFNEDFRRQQALALAQIMMPLAGTGLVNVPELLRHLLREGFGIKNPEKFLMAPNPMMGMGGPPGGPPPDGPQGQGADAPQPSPQDLLTAQQGGIPVGIQNQLAGQVGLPPG